MSKHISQGPCPNPECNSSDAFTLYEDGHGYCFSCRYYKFPDGKVHMLEKVTVKTTLQYVPWRGITEKTMRLFDAKSDVTSDGEAIAIRYQFPSGRTQFRARNEKKFWFTGSNDNPDQPLYGMDKFAPGSGKAINICEGPTDALSAVELLGDYPTVAVTSSSSAAKEAKLAFNYLNSFDKIVICFDNDEPGQKAAKAVASLFDFNKVYVLSMDEGKDVNDYLTEKRQKDFRNAWFSAKRFLPEGIVSSYSEIDDIIDKEESKESVPYPFPTWNEMTYGIRHGEVALITALEGMGKTEIVRAVEYHLLKTTDANIGMIHLEEGKPRMIKGLAGYELNSPVHLPDSTATKDDIKNAFKKLTKRDERVHIYTHFGSDDPDTILSTIRFMVAACDCRYIFLDHITMVVTGSQDEDERRALDYISTKLAHMVEDLNFTLFLVSHVNDDGKTRGSRNISKIADLRIDLKRDILAENEVERNTTYTYISKNRFGSKTGFAGTLRFNPETFKITEVKEGDYPF